MRNLSLIFKKVKSHDFKDVTFFTNDTQQSISDLEARENNSEHCSYFVTDDCIVKSNYFSSDTADIVKLDRGKRIAGLECLEMSRELVYAEDSGEVYTYELTGTAAGDMVTYCEDGLFTMSWSPDQEIVVFVTKARNVVVMRRDYDVINESSLDDQTFGDQEFITVGWGKKETQFHGSEGKGAAKKKDDFQLPENLEEVDKSISVTWRYDGELFAVSYFGCNGRMFKVFSKEGLLQFTSEKCSGLEGPIAWRPSGLWLAVPQVFPNKYVIALFEKNGLRHRELVLPFKNDVETVVQLGWSFDSEVFSVVTLNKETNRSSIYLYTISNYYWYLKQHLPFDGRVVHHKWNFNSTFEGFKPKTLEVVLSDSTWIIYKWDFKVDHSSTFRADDQSVVGVIDGSNLLLSNFRGNVVPPPMAGFTYKNKSPINFVGFIRNEKSDANPNRFFTFDSENRLKIFQCKTMATGSATVRRLVGVYKLFESNRFDERKTPLSYFQFLWLSEDKFVHVELGKVIISKVSFDNPEKTVENLKEILFPDECLRLTSYRSELFVIARDNQTSIYNTSGDLFQTLTHHHSHVDRFSMINSLYFSDQENLITFVNHGELRLGGSNLIAHNVTSYFVTENFLMFTTHDQLKFFDLETRKCVDDRKIETGGRIIVVVPCSSKTVLQMPRGNLETIEPRILSIKIIGELIDRFEYYRAYEIIRKQRINLNLLVDHDFMSFTRNVYIFLNKIENSNWLCLFMSELLDEDVTQTMYGSNYPKRIGIENTTSTNKVNSLCQTFSKYWMTKSANGVENENILPIVTAFVKLKNVEKALTVIWNLKKTEVEQNDTADTVKKSANTADEALKYLVCLVDINELYNTALGMYDFNLVLFVANISQKDPKEYLKFLNDIREIPDINYQHYKIDMHLKRYDRALQSIIKCEGDDRFAECLDLVESQSFYTKAMNLLELDSKKYKEVALIYGNYLRTKGGQDSLWQASIMYERGDDLKQAIMSARHVLDWQRCIYLLKKNQATPEEIQDFCGSILPVLLDAKLFADATKILCDYLNDVRAGIETCLTGRLFREANALSKTIDREVYNTFFRSCFEDAVQSYIYFLHENFEKFNEYTKRLQFVRDNRANQPNGGYAVEDLDPNDDASSVNSMSSMRTGSSSSSRSGKSTTSSKKRRKMERKLTSLKEGSPYEELSLIEALYNLMNLLIGEKFKVNDVNAVLIEHCMCDVGGCSQAFYKQIMNRLKESINEIFIADMDFPSFSDLNNYQAAEKAKYYQLLKPHLRIKPTFDFNFNEFDALQDQKDYIPIKNFFKNKSY